MTKIKSIRLSFVWVDTIPGLLDDAVPGADLAWLGRRGDFIYEFDRRRGSLSPLGDLGVPWRPPDSGRTFWRYYFEDKPVAAISGSQAWKKLAPLRQDLYQFAPAGRAYSEMRVSAYYLSHGMAMVITLNIRGQNLDMLETAKRAVALRHDRILDLPDQPGAKYSLGVLGNTLRDTVRQGRFAGLGSHAGRDQPFSLVTVLEAEGVDLATVAADGDDTHRALEAVTGWNPNFDAVDLADSPIVSARLEGMQQRRLDSDLVYARKSGVALWLPRELSKGRKGRTALSCYHNNLLHGSLQTRSLAEFVHWSRHKATNGGALNKAVTDRAQRAAALLDLIKAGNHATYRSRALARQIKDALGGP